jgi:predicted HTH transcriptional regulator
LEEVVSGVLALTAGEAEGLKPPEFNMEAGAIFTVTLRNTPVYPPETLRWLKQFDGYDLSPNQRRLLAYAHAHGGQFTSRSYQKLVGVDLYTASRDIKDLIRKGMVHLTKKGNRIYKILPRPEASTQKITIPDELQTCIALLPKDGYLTNSTVRQVLGVNRVKAARLLREWAGLGFLEKSGERRWTRYYASPKAYESPSTAHESPSSNMDREDSDS